MNAFSVILSKAFASCESLKTRCGVCSFSSPVLTVESSMSSFQSIVTVYIITLVIIMRQVTGMPRPGEEWSPSRNGCNNGDSKKIQICQHCAKQTKSPIVYPMCCNEEDEVHFWCYRYTTYGKVA